MSLKINSYAGQIGWWLRKKYPNFASWGYLNLQYFLRKHLTDDYIAWFMQQSSIPQPIMISIETINRCNGKCGFCAASVENEKRPLMKMEDELFYSIVQQLIDWDYKNIIALYVNNEPLIDSRIVTFYKYIREKLPEATLLLFTNGTLLTREKMDEFADCIDILIINNYSEHKRLHENLKIICDNIAVNKERFSKMEISVQLRYIHEVLTNRAGAAPNKKIKKIHKEKCLLPYTDITIFPDGRLGICCNDVFEVTDFGNVSEKNIRELWEDSKYKDFRMRMKDGRHQYEYCKYCDFVDAGIREKFIRKSMSR